MKEKKKQKLIELLIAHRTKLRILEKNIQEMAKDMIHLKTEIGEILNEIEK